jgi:hypothetical protein
MSTSDVAIDDGSFVDFFKDALEAEGLSEVDVKTYEDRRGNTIIQARKTIRGEVYGVDYTLTSTELLQVDNVKQHIATCATQVAQKFNEALIERHEWGDKAVDLDLDECRKATCLTCGTEVTLDDHLSLTSVSMAETAVPQPVVGKYSDLPRLTIQMTLLALLRDECEPHCPNSPHDRKF